MSTVNQLLKHKINEYINKINEAEYCSGLSLNIDLFWDNEQDIEFMKAKNFKIMVKELLIGAKKAGMKVVDKRLTQYGDKNPEYGFTYLVVLGQSHIVIHTWPEEKQMNVDVFTCGSEGDPHVIFQHIKDVFKPNHVQFNQNKRGIRKDIESAAENPDKPTDIQTNKK